MYFDPLFAVMSSIDLLLGAVLGSLLLVGEGGSDSLYFLWCVWASFVMRMSGNVSSFLACRDAFLDNLPLWGAAEWMLPIENKNE